MIAHVASRCSQGWRRTLASLVTWLVCPAATALAGDSDALLGRFRSEAPPAWERYLEFANRLQGQITAHDIIGGAPKHSRLIDIKQNARCALLQNQALAGKDTKGEVKAVNAKYSFSLRRNTKDSSWSVTRVVTDKHGNEVDPFDKDVLWAVRANMQALVKVRELTLPELVRSPTFRVLAVKPAGSEGELVDIEFDNAHPVDPDQPDFSSVQGGMLTLAPKQSWTLRRATLRCKYLNGSGTGEIQAEPASPGSSFPVPRRVTTRLVTKTDGGKSIAVMAEAAYDVGEGDPPDSEFTLTAFGFPEPKLAGRRPVYTRWYVLASVVGIILLVAGGLIRRRTHGKGFPSARVAGPSTHT